MFLQLKRQAISLSWIWKEISLRWIRREMHLSADNLFLLWTLEKISAANLTSFTKILFSTMNIFHLALYKYIYPAQHFFGLSQHIFSSCSVFINISSTAFVRLSQHTLVQASWPPNPESRHFSTEKTFFCFLTFIKRWHLREKIRLVCSKSPPLGWWAAFLKVNILSYQECPHPFQLQRWEGGTTRKKSTKIESR